MITSLTWIPRGAARAQPVRYEISKEEYDHITALAREELAEGEEGGDAEADGEAKEEVDTSDLPPELRMDQYDEEDDIPLGNLGELGDLGDYGVQQHFDVALAVDAEDDDSDAEDDMIRETDSLLIVAHTEDEHSYLEVQVLDENANLYVHHDITLPSFPLCLAWLDCPPHMANSDEQTHMIGNYVAVGSFEPAIEIWNVDVLDPLEPSCVLGGVDATQKKPKKGKKKALRKPAFKADSHSDAVLALCWNKEHRQLLASGSADCSVKLWDVTTQQCSYTFTHHRDKVSAVRWHPQEGSVLATGAYDKSVAVLDARTPDAVSRFEVTADLEHLEWDPFRPFNLTAASEDGVIVCKDVRAMDRAIFQFQAHETTVSSFSYSPCVEGLMATASLDKTVKLWDVHAPEPFGVAYKTMAVGKLVTLQFYSDDPFVLATGGSKGMVAVWDTSELEVVRRHFGERVHTPRSAYTVTAESTELAAQVEQMTLSEQSQVAMGEESTEQTAGASSSAAGKKKKSKAKGK